MAFPTRPAAPEDCAALTTLIAQHARYEGSAATITRKALGQILANPSPPVGILLAEADSEIAGYAALTFDYSLWHARRWAHLDCLFVAERFRGRGIGADLLHAACARARESGVLRIEWQTPAWNRDAARFYEREGASTSPKLRFGLDLNL